jgi:hypothetical protein
MSDDIRLKASFWRHPKTLELEARVRWGRCCLLQLWSLVGELRDRSRDGDLGGWSPHILEGIVGWPGEPGTMIQILTETGWVDIGDDGRPRLRGWATHQTWAAKADDRSKASQKAAHSRWGKSEDGPSDAPRIETAYAPQCDPHEALMRPASTPDAPRIETACAPQCDPHEALMRPASTPDAHRNAPSPSLPLLSAAGSCQQAAEEERKRPLAGLPPDRVGERARDSSSSAPGLALPKPEASSSRATGKSTSTPTPTPTATPRPTPTPRPSPAGPGQGKGTAGEVRPRDTTSDSLRQALASPPDDEQRKRNAVQARAIASTLMRTSLRASGEGGDGW